MSEESSDVNRWSSRAVYVAVGVVLVMGLLWFWDRRTPDIVELALLAEDGDRAGAAAEVVERRADRSGLGALDASAGDGGAVRLVWPDATGGARNVTDRDAVLLASDGPVIRPVLEELPEPGDAERGELTIREDELRGLLGLREGQRAVVLEAAPSVAPEIDRESPEFRELLRIERRMALPAETPWRDLRPDAPEVYMKDGRGVLLRLGPVVLGPADWTGASTEGEGAATVLVLEAEGAAASADRLRNEEGAGRLAVAAGPRVLSVIETPPDPTRISVAPVDARAGFLAVRVVEEPLPTRLVPAPPAQPGISPG